MAGNSGGSQNTTTQVIPYEGVQPFLDSAFQSLQDQTDSPRTFFPGSTVAPQSAATQSGVNSLTNAAQQQQGVANQVSDQFQFFTGDALSPDSNPFLAESARNAVKPIFEQLTQNVLPGIDRGAVQAGGFGGTAQANLQGDAIDRATTRALDASNNVFANAFENSSNRATDLIKSSPFLSSTFSAPGQTQLQAGAVTDSFNQAGVNEDVNRHNFEQTGQFDQLLQYLSALQGVPFGQSTTAPGPTGPSFLNGALGGAGLGAAASAIPGLQPFAPFLLGGGAAVGGASTLF